MGEVPEEQGFKVYDATATCSTTRVIPSDHVKVLLPVFAAVVCVGLFFLSFAFRDDGLIPCPSWT